MTDDKSGGLDRFRGVDLSGATFHDVDLTGVVMRGVLLVGADIDGVISGLRINGVDVAPLVSAELDRMYPERIALRATDAEGMRSAWKLLGAMWHETESRGRRLGETALRERVDDEWSFVETVRHLIFATDAWFSRSILDLPDPFHPIGLPPSFVTDAAHYGIDLHAEPSLEDVFAVRQERRAAVRAFLEAVDDAELARSRSATSPLGFPSQVLRTAAQCLRALFDEEWAHHRYAVRDLARLEAGAPR